jgi:hypothetical protein
MLAGALRLYVQIRLRPTPSGRSSHQPGPLPCNTCGLVSCIVHSWCWPSPPGRRRAQGFPDDLPRRVPTDQSHWHYNADREIKLDQPAKVVYLRYEGDPGVNSLRIYAHCLDDRPVRTNPITITHTWTENGVPKTHKVTLAKPGFYEITTDADPVDESIELACPVPP